MSWLANIVYIIAGICYLPVLVYAMVVQHKNRRGWGEKLCGPRPSLRAVHSEGTIWIHAVSLGEINAARGIIAGLEQRCGREKLVISTTTDTGHARAVELFGAERVFRYPLDFTWAVQRSLRRLNPQLIVLMELEVWYNLTTKAARRGVPVCVVNGRLTERSCRRFGWIAPIARRMFASLRWVGAQDHATAERFIGLGVPNERVSVTGSVKWDTAAVAESIPGQDELTSALGITNSAPFWVCGSTGPGEEALLLDVHAKLREKQPALQLALIPRKPERFDEVADLIRKRGYACTRRSQHRDGQMAVAESVATPRVILGDTMGELRKFYALADVVFVGRSLVPMGGSDPMEAAALGKPIVTGPHMDNFAQPVTALAAGGALVRASGAQQISDQLGAWLGDASAAARAGQAGRATVVQNQGATQRTVDYLANLLKAARGGVRDEVKTDTVPTQV